MHHWDLSTVHLSGVSAPPRPKHCTFVKCQCTTETWALYVCQESMHHWDLWALYVCQMSMHHWDLSTVRLSSVNAPLRPEHCTFVRCQCTTETWALYVCQVSMHHGDLSTVSLSGVNAPLTFSFLSSASCSVLMSQASCPSGSVVLRYSHLEQTFTSTIIRN